mmetsp:Transcript_99278/g.241449  ORF Transcript_99278/g.241449 Transcript_99278/m.241449 type:complete len:361 (+) Transcript_99278:545-1627(+)
MPWAFMLPDELMLSGRLLRKTPMTKGSAASAEEVPESAEADLLMRMPMTRDSGTASMRMPSQIMTALCWFLSWGAAVAGPSNAVTTPSSPLAMGAAFSLFGDSGCERGAAVTGSTSGLATESRTIELTLTEVFEELRLLSSPLWVCRSSSCSSSSRSVTWPMFAETKRPKAGSCSSGSWTATSSSQPRSWPKLFSLGSGPSPTVEEDTRRSKDLCEAVLGSGFGSASSLEKNRSTSLEAFQDVVAGTSPGNDGGSAGTTGGAAGGSEGTLSMKASSCCVFGIAMSMSPRWMISTEQGSSATKVKGLLGLHVFKCSVHRSLQACSVLLAPLSALHSVEPRTRQRTGVSAFTLPLKMTSPGW